MTDQEKKFIDDCGRELRGISDKLNVIAEVKERIRTLESRLQSYAFHKRQGLEFPWPSPTGGLEMLRPNKA